VDRREAIKWKRSGSAEHAAGASVPRKVKRVLLKRNELLAGWEGSIKRNPPLELSSAQGRCGDDPRSSKELSIASKESYSRESREERNLQGKIKVDK